MREKQWLCSLWFEDGSSISLRFLLIDPHSGKKHLALYDRDGVCQLADFLCFRAIKAPEEEIVGLLKSCGILPGI